MSNKANSEPLVPPEQSGDLLGGFHDIGLRPKPARIDTGPVPQETQQPARSSKSNKAGHRERQRRRFTKGGPEAVHDYELLELILFRAIPRKDIKDLAKTLIAKFGSFSGVIQAPERLLLEVPEVGNAVVFELKLVRAAALELMREEIMDQPVLSSWQQVIDYCRVAMGYETREQFRILFLDKKNKLIADEVQGEGTVDHTPVYIREVVRRALELSATALVLVHNHPSGDTKPSRADIDMTRMIQSAAKPLGITLHDHLIVGRGVHFSFRNEKLL